ncbi:MAG TPA: zinc ribbon domain-containing protein, partial [Gemmatimonadaceae bacterium]|nr:zinc ribbon domain-containing protein [Gemmatimonadaceae bacterium]
MSEKRSSVEAVVAEGLCPVCQSPRPDLSKPCPHCGSPAIEGAEPPSPTTPVGRRSMPEGLFTVRSSDIEPYIGLRYLSKLFRLMAIILVLVLIAEIITGFVQLGQVALPRLLGEASRLIVLAGLLWGIGDLAILLIDVGHDV